MASPPARQPVAPADNSFSVEDFDVLQIAPQKSQQHYVRVNVSQSTDTHVSLFSYITDLRR
jgi:hypothetical protein